MSIDEHRQTRWQTRFGRFVRRYGAAKLARDLNVEPSAIYQWIRGYTAPRPQTIVTIVLLSRENRTRLTITDIYAQRELGNEHRLERKVARIVDIRSISVC